MDRQNYDSQDRGSIAARAAKMILLVFFHAPMTLHCHEESVAVDPTKQYVVHNTQLIKQA